MQPDRIKTSGSSHFGNSEVRWLDNLLYLYTKPFETSAVTVQKYAEDLSVLPPIEVNLRIPAIADRVSD